MNREELDRELDIWLDRAAAEYGKADIRPGFEIRIVSKLNSRLAKRRRYFRWVPAATAVAAILFFSVYLPRNRFQGRRSMEIASQGRAAIEIVPGPNADIARTDARRLDSRPSNGSIPGPSSKRSARHPVTLRAREAGKGRFLSSGLSDRERYLIAFVHAKSNETSLDIPKKNVVYPLQIEEIRIPEFHIRDFEISSFGIEASPTTIPENEEQL